MSQENVEIVRRIYSAFNSGAIDAALELNSADAELRDLQSAPDQPFAVKGVDAMREVLTNWTAAFDDLSADVTEFIDAGDAVIATAHWRGKGSLEAAGLGEAG